MCDRNVENLSGGELQRFAIAVVAAQQVRAAAQQHSRTGSVLLQPLLCLPPAWLQADVYMIDEPSSYLDVRQRLKAAKVGPSPTSSLRGRARLSALPPSPRPDCPGCH